MIDSNNINVMREKLRKIGRGSGDVQEEIERIDNLIGSSPIPGAQRTITGSLNYLYDNLGGGVDYSTEEQDTGLKWIDGRTVYQKSYIGTIANGLFTNIETNFNHTLVECNGVAYATNGQFLSLGVISGVNEWAIALHKSQDGALCITAGSGTYNGTYYVTIRYVKNEE